MKKYILGILMLLTAVSTQAARAYSEPFTVSQPDGTQLILTLHGDEHLSWLTTSDGTMVMETSNGYFVASIEDNGKLSATRFLAHSPNLRSIEETQTCQKQQQRKDLFFNRVEKTWKAARRAHVTSSDYFPHIGSPKCLVILVNFQDVEFSSDEPLVQFEQYLNGDEQISMGHREEMNITSVRKYFEISSHGLFSPQFDLVGPFTLPQTMEYYGAHSDNSNDVNFNQFCKDVIAAADDFVDFRNYDNTGDGKAELVSVIFAGYGENIGGNPSNTIWPKCAPRGLATNDGVSVNYINCNAELYQVSLNDMINGIGVFCHEFSHGMGLPDLYVTKDEAKVNNQSPEFFDLMDYGEHSYRGFAPTPYSVWEQEVFGWIEVEQLSESQTGIELKPLLQGGKAYKFNNGANDEEWMMIENVQNYDYSNHMPGVPYGHGMLVWHISYDSHNVSSNDYPNNEPYHPRVCIVPSGGEIINGYLLDDGTYTGDEYWGSLESTPFPGVSEVTTLTAEQQLPNYLFYNGEETPVFKLLNINENPETGIVTFDFDNGTGTGIHSINNEPLGPINEAMYDLAGRHIRSVTRPGLYISKGKKMIIQ